MSAESPPFYFIYGEHDRTLDPRFAHVERVGDRHALHGGLVKPHSHPHLHQMSLWLRAEGDYVVDGDRHQLNDMTLIWMPSGTIHGFDVTPASDCIVVSVSSDFLMECMNGMETADSLTRLRRPILSAVPKDHSATVSESFRQLEHEYAYPAWGQSHAIGAHVRLMLITLTRVAYAQEDERIAKGAQPELYGRFLALLDRDFRCQHTVETYAARLGTTPYLLNQATVASAGMRPSHVIRARIILEAKRLLLYTALEVAEVAYSLGFEDPPHFGRLFRREAGASPGRWRSAQRALAQGEIAAQ